MCGRYTLKTLPSQLGLPFGPDDDGAAYAPRYNIAPGQVCHAVRTVNGEAVTAMLKWGLLPRFVADPKGSAHPINARAETVATNGFFKGAFAHRRCLVPADGFYEPEEDAHGEKTGRWWYFKREDNAPFCFASLWESWGEGDGRIETHTLITTEPMTEVSRCGHQRSPVILPPEKFDLWLDQKATVPQLKKLLRPHSSDAFTGYLTSGRAKNSRNQGPDLIERVEE